MATQAGAPPPYNPPRATRLQRYLLKIIAYSLEVEISKLVKAIPFEWPTYDGFRASLLQKKEQAHLLRLPKTITYMHCQIATSTLEDGRTILLEAVEPSRTLKIDPGFTLELMAAYANDHLKSWKQKRKHNLITDLAKSVCTPEMRSRTWLYLNVISQLVLQLSPNDAMQKTLGFTLEKYHRGRHQELGFMPVLDPRDTHYWGYSNLAEFLTGITMVGENGTWQQLLELVPYRHHRSISFTVIRKRSNDFR
ncbi:hypothetical protein G6011_08104 [Alternaria panax]|uniref:Uncharacterized protein n=1 Tax=Alternaria panax TaxID=48097 RepID=A0AAD4I9J4_9PLEO|nr:hypothetical protein G6011_08104 [Alternaria panax]